MGFTVLSIIVEAAAKRTVRLTGVHPEPSLWDFNERERKGRGARVEGDREELQR